MSFLAPLFLAGAITAAIPIVLHLLKREPDRRVRFSSVSLLRTAPIEHTSRRHLRELLLLAARVTALLLLALAFARPFFTGPMAATADGITVVALDTSASVSAAAQFVAARQRARAAVERASGQVAVVTFADEARVVADPSGDRSTALAAIASARAGPGATNYRAALQGATTVLHGRPGTIVVVTDLQASGWDEGDRVVVPESVRIEIADVGIPPSNLAVVSAHVAGNQVIATIRNGGDSRRDARVSLAVHGDASAEGSARGASESTIPVGPGLSAEVAFPAPRGAWAAVRVEDGTGAVEDNVRYLVLDGVVRPTVLAVTSAGDLDREAFYLAQALGAPGSHDGAFAVEGVGGAALQTWDQMRFDRYAAIILMSTRGLDHHGRAMLATYIRQGGGVLVGAGPDVDGDVAVESLGGATFTLVPPIAGAGGPAAVRTLAPADVRHPIFRVLADRSSIGLVTFRRVTTIRAPGCQALARFTTGEPAMVECDAGQGRALIVASDLDNRGNDFPLHATFVPFLHEAVGYLSRSRQSSSDYLVGRTPPGVPPVPGVVQMRGATGNDGRFVAVNVDPAESDTTRITVEQFQAAIARQRDQPAGVQPPATAIEQEARYHLWQYALAVMFVALMFESMVAMRTA